MENKVSGSLVCVGLGITLGAHITPAAMNQIVEADIVFVAASNGIVEKWVESLNANCVSLQKYYSETKPRKITYLEMQNVLLENVRNGKRVCGAFYGHPCVFAQAPRKAVQQAKKEGFEAYIEPGISAEACLYADLAIDPGQKGLVQYETSQFMGYKRNLDTAAYLILWQIGLAGDIASNSFNTDTRKLQMLVDKLFRSYPLDHEVIIYEARVLPTDRVRVDRVRLSKLPNAELSMISTLVVPPATRLIDITDKPMSNRLNKE